jgi:hypothetical protein
MALAEELRFALNAGPAKADAAQELIRQLESFGAKQAKILEAARGRTGR